MFLGETLKEKQAPRNASKSSSSTNRLRDFKETVSNMIHNRPSLASQTTLGPPCVGKGGEQTDKKPPRSLPLHSRDWEVESTSSESKSSSSSKYRPTWRPKRESLNIDSIFSKDKRKHSGYTQLSPFSEDSGEKIIREELSFWIKLIFIYIYIKPGFSGRLGKYIFTLKGKNFTLMSGLLWIWAQWMSH